MIGICDIVRADPAGNITAFVLDRVDDKRRRVEMANALLAAPGLGIEQAGFVLPPPANASGLYRLEMAGGEFCGNAARSFGLWAALREGKSGETDERIEISGASGPMTVKINTEKSFAEARMPLPERVGKLRYEGNEFPVLFFEGITHVIMRQIGQCGADAKAREEFERVRAAVEDEFPGGEKSFLSAMGIMHYMEEDGALTMAPLVWVRETGSLVAESSCGSGSTALAAWKARDLGDGDYCFPIRQRGGVIETRVVKRNGGIAEIYIGGKVTLSGEMKVRINR